MVGLISCAKPSSTKHDYWNCVLFGYVLLLGKGKPKSGGERHLPLPQTPTPSAFLAGSEEQGVVTGSEEPGVLAGSGGECGGVIFPYTTKASAVRVCSRERSILGDERSLLVKKRSASGKRGRIWDENGSGEAERGRG